MARILVTGASGMLGSTIVRRWAHGRDAVFATGGGQPGWDVPVPYRAFDLRTQSSELVDWAQPEVIVHCAALTNVDACEDDPEAAREINGRSVGRLIEAAPSARMLYVSSDAVLGDADRPASEAAHPAPLTAYARAKLEGEQHARAERDCVIRTTVVGANAAAGRQSFAEWIVRSLRTGKRIPLFADVRFSPIAAPDLADELLFISGHEAPRLVHVVGSEPVSKYDFGVRLAGALNLDASLIEVGSVQTLKTRARRVGDQTLDCQAYECYVGRRLPDLARTIAVLKSELEK